MVEVHQSGLNCDGVMDVKIDFYRAAVARSGLHVGDGGNHVGRQIQRIDADFAGVVTRQVGQQQIPFLVGFACRAVFQHHRHMSDTVRGDQRQALLAVAQRVQAAIQQRQATLG